MGGPTVEDVDLVEVLELVHSTCQQVIANAGYLHRKGLHRALVALGWSLGLDRLEAGGPGRKGVDVVLGRQGRPVVAVAVDAELSASRALALLDSGAPVGVLVVASALGDAWRSALPGFVKSAVPSRGGALVRSGVHAVLLNLRLEGGDVVEDGGDTPVRWFPVPELLLATGAATGGGDGPVRTIHEPGSSVSLGPGARDNVDREAYPLFPYDRVRAGQRQFMDDVRATVDALGLLVAHAPTGIGKTVSALVPAVQHALATGRIVMFLTPKQSQHRVAVETLRRMADRSGKDLKVVDIIAKQAMCPRVSSDEGYAAFHEFCRAQVRAGKCALHLRSNAQVVRAVHGRIMHVHELVAAARHARVCPHKAAMDAAAGANVVVCDYNYVFTPELAEAVIARLDRDWEDIVLVVDEAHNLPERARAAGSGALSTPLLERAAEELRVAKAPVLRSLLSRLSIRLEGLALDLAEGEERPTDAATWAAAVEAELASGLERLTYKDLVAMLEETAEALVGDDEPGGSAVAEVASFMEGFARPGEATLRLLSREGHARLRYVLLDPSVVTRDRFASVHAAVLMSGTLWPAQMYADLLGLPEDRTRLGAYRSPFPPENRLLLVDGGVTTRYTSRGPEMYGRIAESVRSVLEATPGNVAVFAPSYDILSRVREGLAEGGGTGARGAGAGAGAGTGARGPGAGVGAVGGAAAPKEVLVEERGMGKRDRERLCDRLEELRNGGGAALLGVQGGSLSEGVDYLENLLSAVVVVGLPLAPPSKEGDALVAHFERKFGGGRGEDYGYVNPAMNRVVQAAGRLIRTERDRGVVVLLDERFLQPRYARCLPPDWAPRPAKDLGADVAAFFALAAPGRQGPRGPVARANPSGRRARSR